jgi:hypothetical protein
MGPLLGDSVTNLRNPKDWRNSFWDWTFYNECFAPTRIRLTDIDGFVERQGNFLILETKRPGAILPEGQRIMFKRMAKTGLFTIFIIWGPTNIPQEIIQITQSIWTSPKKCNTAILKRMIREWFENASYSNYSPTYKNEIIQLALDIQRKSLVGTGDLSFLAGALVQKVYDLFQE